MTEEIKTDEKFQQAALFDLEFEKREQKNADRKHEAAGYSADRAEYDKTNEAKYNQWSAQLSLESKPLKSVLFHLEGASPEIKSQAILYLNNLVNKDELDLRRENRNNKNKEIDLDGSKKSLWGKLKNKAKNFWKPHNNKKMLEEAIGVLRNDMIKNPEFYDSLKKTVYHSGQNKINFQNLSQALKEDEQYYNNQRVDYMIHKQKEQAAAQKLENEAKTSEATIDAIHQVRDNAAKEIELRSAARENIGVKDAQANTGVDKLADKAKAMEGMTPEQRLAFRMSQLRGTSKETPTKPVQKRDVDSNVMNKALESKMRA